MIVRRGVFWPLLLIVVGAAFLLANLQVIPALPVRALLTLWPLLLILIGVDIAVGRRNAAAALLVEAALVLGAVALVVTSPSIFERDVFFGSGPAAGTSHVVAERGSAQSLTLHVNGGAGSYDLRSGTDALVEATSENEDLELRERTTANVTDVRVDQRTNRLGGRPGHVDVRVAASVPTSLDVNAGAGDFVVDLHDLRITDARLSVGAASLRLVLPKATGDVAVTVSAGASSVVIEIPDGVEARVNTSGALMSVNSQNARVVGSETSGYASAKDRVTVRVTAGASSVVIR